MHKTWNTRRKRLTRSSGDDNADTTSAGRNRTIWIAQPDFASCHQLLQQGDLAHAQLKERGMQFDVVPTKWKYKKASSNSITARLGNHRE